MRRKLVVGNWKMFGRLARNQALLEGVAAGVRDLRNTDCAVCVPYPYLAQAQALLQGSNVAWGAQNMSHHEEGAYTGEVAAGMLVEFGCKYVILGHSERRGLYHESDETVAMKFDAALKAGLQPILCVGETLAEREAGITEEIVARQLDEVVNRAGVKALEKAVVAYEPVWAIGTGKTASPDQAQAVHAFIRQRVAKLDGQVAQGLCILYGGSVKAANAAELFSMADIDGGLIGGASLVAEDFVAICRAGK
ncbi:MAG: triose-phosphate isomerase [Gallionellales bacterium 35-53-114]|jgi:triosephosphate isomerase|nr:MAG: triose-phosphate isomerase [Gallionellales bacterium 35-53-114]OYZ62867.1 MAG: triose-phosphate isomerase [Gallionellales bacterium 24-53-125]OZB09943.1 MAG: triose-phosphate isomerase [Gallionellales bacterium 39-52-133]HQS58385.1 triose-phosphate isomerase [Gallionellaceae bacterium]HQS73940.1 triose-phosphate isomerase [Gallionellaceae bacterium]